MKAKTLILPLYIKILLVFGDRLVLFGILFNIPLLIICGLGIDAEGVISIEISNLIIPEIVLFSGILRSMVYITRIETANEIKKGVYVGEIVLHQNRKSFHNRLLLRLSIQLPISNEKSIEKNYYLLSDSISKNKYDLTFLYNTNQPEKAVLINLFPKLVRQYILKAGSTITNNQE